MGNACASGSKAEGAANAAPQQPQVATEQPPKNAQPAFQTPKNDSAAASQPVPAAVAPAPAPASAPAPAAESAPPAPTQQQEQQPAAAAAAAAESAPIPAAAAESAAPPVQQEEKKQEAAAPAAAASGRIPTQSEIENDPELNLSGFPLFLDSNTSLLKKNLTPEIYNALRGKKSPNGFTIEHAIQSCVDNQDSGMGIYAGDEETYEIFAPIFDRVISDYHGGYPADGKHVSDLDPSHLNAGEPLDPTDEFIVSTRIRVGRNIRGFGLPPGTTRAQRRTVERLVTDALNSMTGDLQGTYYPLASMTEQQAKQLIEDHFLFKKGDRFLESAGVNRDWPDSRGIFHNNDKTFLVWVNEEDQLRIISMQKGGDFAQVFERLMRAVGAIESKLGEMGHKFAFNEHLGYIHSCPSNLGTGMRASVHMKIPLLSKHAQFKDIMAKLRLQARGIHGEHSESEGGVFDISNKERLGKSEVSLVQTMVDGVRKLIELEKALKAGNSIDVASL